MAGWLDALDDRSGPLGAAARAFCAAHAIEPTIRGLAAARALGRALDAFCHQVEGDDLDEDDRFVEQAGAYLGLVVLDGAPYDGRTGNAVLGIYQRSGTVITAGSTDWAHGLRGGDEIVERITRNVIEKLGR